MKLSVSASATDRFEMWVQCRGVTAFKLDQQNQEIYGGHLEIEELQSRGWDSDKVFRIFDPEQDDEISFYSRTLEWCVEARPS